jgi:DNA-binding NtrC family response regulator
MSKKTILIFDSEPSFIELLTVIFEESDYQIESSDSSQNIIRQINHHKPHVIIIDTWMSGNNAIQLTRLIRQDLYLNAMPVILMGTHYNLSIQAQKASADDFIPKPFNIEELEQKILKYSTNTSIDLCYS